MRKRWLTFLGLIVLGVEVPFLVADEPVNFARQIKPILSKNCYACHGPDPQHRESGLALHDPQLAFAETDSGEAAIIKGDADASPLLKRVLSDDESSRMPPAEHAPKLTAVEIDLVRRWINEGANYQKHWAYEPIVSPALPAINDTTWPINPIDHFVLTRLESQGLKPEGEAPPERLIRRLYLDLVGIPPSPAEVAEFIKQPDQAAYEKCIDNLLADPRYGEHWARGWLDLARYADSQGYAQDEIREIWKYRDWVIDAFNRDLPFDQFTIEQLAGDLLPNPTEDQLIATAFHRNTMTNTEGGTDDEEFRHAAIVDRTNTTGTVWLGTTVGCAQCHTHKYDPITHQDYYRFFAIFNQSADNDQPDNSPVLEQYSAEQVTQRSRLQQRMAEVEQKLTGVDEEQKKILEEEQKSIQNELNRIRPTATPIMKELTQDQRRATHIAIGGAFSNPGEMVTAGLLSEFADTQSKEANDINDVNRLRMAQWLVSPENPLTARVAVNRHWEKIFGVGIVETIEDFGSQGAVPSHPELLDWLADRFRSDGWSMKRLVKLIVMSATYRQDSRTPPEKLARDPGNRLLSRGARYRLTGEQIRDLSLACSGLLSPKMYGPPVRPPQPKTGLSAAFGGSLDWDPSPGEDRYRRAIYTLMRRTNMYPSFMAFDGTNRTVCTVRRIQTNTPVAAFVTLNDPVFVECAQAMSRRIDREFPNGTIDERIAFAFSLVTARKPNEQERNELNHLYQEQYERFLADPAAAKLMAFSEIGEEPGAVTIPDKIPERAAWTVVANVLLNLDETLTRN